MKWYGWGAEEKYYNLDNKPDFWPYLKDKLEVNSFEDTPCISYAEIKLPEANIPDELMNRLQETFYTGQIKTDKMSRLTHSFGKSYRDLVNVRQGKVNHPPDLVVYPKSHDEVFQLITLAKEFNFKIIPFGGGTSVVGGVEPKVENGEIVLSMDLKKMNAIKKIDHKSMIATIEAGILGPELEEQLNLEGLTLGHYPQSFEFSTLGGWLAARSAGQQSNAYGKIEKMIMGIKMISPNGTIETITVPASASGPDLKQLIVGSEGILGVITEASMQLHHLPETKEYHGIFFQSYRAGIEAIRQLIQNGCKPAMIRLSDENETEALFKLREPTNSKLKKVFNGVMKTYLKQAKGLDFKSGCLMLIGFEGSDKQVHFESSQAIDFCNKNGGVSLGTSIGEHWYGSRFELPYLRDIVLDKGILIDTLETSTIWSNLISLYLAVKKALKSHLPNSIILCHISHVYKTGASLYFTFIAPQDIGHEIEQWQKAKTAATEAISSSKGALSHHHGLGYEHAQYLDKEVSDTGVQVLHALKCNLDPDGLMNPNKVLLRQSK